MIFTSNKNPALWREDFDEDATLLCALDRIFDDATVFKLRGESFRGKKLETVSLQTGKVKAVEPPNAPGEQKLNLTIWAVWSFLLGRFWRFQLSPNWSFLPDANNSGNYVSRIGTMRLEVFSMTHRTWSYLRNFSHQTNYNYFVFLTIMQYFYGQNCYDVISQMKKHSWVRRFTR